jgi:hypothetical protein
MKDLEIIEKISELFMRYGIKSVSMDDVSRQLGMSKKTLYKLVGSKEDLVSKVIQQHLIAEKNDIDEICGHSKNAIHEMLTIGRHVSKMLRQTNPSTVYDLQKYYGKCWTEFESLHQEHVYGVIKNNISNGMKEGIYRGNIDPDIVAKFYVGKSFVLVDERIFPTAKYNKEELFLEFITYHIHGIASQKGLELLEKHLLEKEDE